MSKDEAKTTERDEPKGKEEARSSGKEEARSSRPRPKSGLATKPAGWAEDDAGNLVMQFEEETEYERSVRINGKGGSE